MKRQRFSREIWGLVVLFALFLASAVYYERKAQEVTPHETPTSFNTSSAGVKALYLLLDSQGYAVNRLETSWNGLNSQHGLLVLIEPFTRNVEKGEIDALKRWVTQGGTVLFLVTAPPRPLDASDSVFGDIALVNGAEAAQEVAPSVTNSPYTENVKAMRFESPVRLQPARKRVYQTLFAVSDGALALTKPLGKGRVILVANSGAASNANVKEADNAVFLVNVAATALGESGRMILFDEYHHGVGFASRGPSDGIMQHLPLPLRLTLWHGVALLLLLIYNGNRRFGRPLPSPQVNARPSTDYLGSMARLFRRAHAADVAFLPLYRRFVRDLARHLNLPPDVNQERLAQQAEQTCEVDGAALRTFLTRCEEVVAGERIGEPEMLRLAAQCETFRRRCHLVGTE